MNTLTHAVRVKYALPPVAETREFVHAQEYYTAWPCDHSAARLDRAAVALVSSSARLWPTFFAPRN